VFERVLAAVGAAFLVVGPLLQAINELRRSTELLEALGKSGLADAARQGADLSLKAAMIPGVGFLLRLPGLLKWSNLYTKAFVDFANRVSAPGADEIRAGLIRTRNWTIVVLGALLVFIAACVAVGKAA